MYVCGHGYKATQTMLVNIPQIMQKLIKVCCGLREKILLKVYDVLRSSS